MRFYKIIASARAVAHFRAGTHIGLPMFHGCHASKPYQDLDRLARNGSHYDLCACLGNQNLTWISLGESRDNILGKNVYWPPDEKEKSTSHSQRRSKS